MSQPTSPYEAAPPSAGRLWRATAIAAVGAALALVLFVLPAEYGVDPTGFGHATGLTAMRGSGGKTFQVKDVVGGNESYRNVAVPDAGQPVPLPNPAVHQDEAQRYATRTVEIRLGPEQETEMKTALQAGKMILYEWHTDRGAVYTDFHGHDPEAGDEYWVRYKEQMEGAGNSGSLVAPFTGEHGWYWLNYNDFPVVVTLTVAGYFDDIIDYGVHSGLQ
jgi:hypothetical protein